MFPSPGRRARLAPAAVALILAFAAYAPALRTDRRLAGRDLYTLYEPLFLRVAAAWRGEGSLLRDPLRGCGMPLLADPLAQVAYPPGWLRALLPFQLAHALLFPLHAALCGAGAGLLARRLGAGARGACLAAAAAALAGPVLSASRTPNLLAGVAWLGFALAGLIELPQGGTRARRGLALAALAIAMMLLGGGVELVLLLGVGTGVAALRLQGDAARDRSGTQVPEVLAARENTVGMHPGAAPRGSERSRPQRSRRGAAVRFLAGAALACALGAALAGAQLLPFLRWFPESQRAAEAAEERRAPVAAAQAAAVWAIDPLRLPELVTPGISPGAAPSLYARGPLARVADGWHPFPLPLHASVHLGLPVVALALLAAWRARGPGPAAGLALACAAWLLIALRLGRPPGFATASPFFELLRALPGLGGWRYPGKALLPLCVVLPALAGLGLRGLAPRLRLPAFALTAALGLLAQRLDPEVLPTLPAAVVEEPPPVAREILAREGPPPRGRYLRARRVPGAAPGAGFEAVRALHREVLIEDLPGRFGIPAVAAYPPFYNRRLEPWLRARDVDDPRLWLEGSIGHVLDRDGTLRHRPAAPRARLEGEGALRVVAWEAARIELELDLPKDGAVFVSEAFEPAWSAELADRPVALEEAEGLFIRARVPAGRHRLALAYSPPGLLPGALLTVAAAALLLWLAFARVDSALP